MQKVFGILFIVAAIWVGMEVYDKGTAGAFDGLLVKLHVVGPASTAAPHTEAVSDPLKGYVGAKERAAAKLRGAYDTGYQRGDRPERAEAQSAGERTAARARAMAGR